MKSIQRGEGEGERGGGGGGGGGGGRDGEHRRVREGERGWR